MVQCSWLFIIYILGSNAKKRFEIYIEKLENPSDEIFKGYEEDLSTDEKESIKVLARHIKLRGDFLHNITTKQTKSAKELKEPEYLRLLDHYYPNWREYLSPSQKERINQYNPKILEVIEKNRSNVTKTIK